MALVAGDRQDVQTVDWNGEDAWFSIKVKLVFAFIAAFTTDKRKFVVRKLLSYNVYAVIIHQVLLDYEIHFYTFTYLGMNVKSLVNNLSMKMAVSINIWRFPVLQI